VQCRKLVAQGFSAAGRHQHESVTARNQVLYDFPLIKAKLMQTENLAQGIVDQIHGIFYLESGAGWVEVNVHHSVSTGKSAFSCTL
jgi:hypothetical protein